MAGHSIADRKNRDLDSGAVLPPLPHGLSPGRLVTVRGSRWRVVAAVDHADCRELHLHGPAAEARVLLWPFDRPAPVASRPRLRVVPLHRWSRRAWRALSYSLDPRTPRATFSGEVLPYQLAPAVAMRSGACRVLLADEVGLGKTIQAGWILADLLAREPGTRALVAVPASLREQWASELETRFALSPARVDAAWLRAAVADRAADVSPWAAPGAYLGSIDFLKRPDVAVSLGEVVWDLLVVDEAHAAAAPTGRHAALARVAAASRRVVAITATPYSGDAAAFASMLSLGEMPGEGAPLMFRRSRHEVGDRRARHHHFATIRITASEGRLQRLLERYTRAVWQHAPDLADAARLAMTILRKRALSSPAAARRSLARRLELLRGAVPAPRQLSLFTDPPEADDVLPEAVLATPGLKDADMETRWLAALVDAADRASLADSKLRYLLRLLARVRGEPVIVFTEYRDTLHQLAGVLPQALQLHGGLAGGDRSAVTRCFNEQGGLLLATDAAAEGLNLQRRCRLVVNYELPWNPARLEQRIGRVDRIGQRRRVHAISLVARDTAEDLVVAALSRRLARVAATLGERDRLASFLTEARTARLVIGPPAVEPIDETPQVAAPVRPLPAEYPVDLVASEIAAVGRRRRVTAASFVVPVARTRAHSPLAPGCVVVVRAAAVNDAGVVAERTFLVHVDIAHDAPADVEAMARVAAHIVQRSCPALEVIRDWFGQTRHLHRAALDARIEREQRLRAHVEPRPELQPGLFDRRAIDEDERGAGVETRRRLEHAEHLRRLNGALELRLECAAAAIWVACR